MRDVTKPRENVLQSVNASFISAECHFPRGEIPAGPPALAWLPARVGRAGTGHGPWWGQAVAITGTGHGLWWGQAVGYHSALPWATPPETDAVLFLFWLPQLALPNEAILVCFTMPVALAMPSGQGTHTCRALLMGESLCWPL